MTQSRVKQFASTALIFLLSLCTACTTMQPVNVDAVGSEIRSQVHTGDTVLLTRDNRSERLRVTTVGDSALIGISDGARVEIPYQAIQRLEVRRVSSAKTAWLVIGAVAAIVLGIAVVNHDQHHLSGNYSF